VFLGAVGDHNALEGNPWAVTLQLRTKNVEFNIDTGAEVTVISEAVWRDIGQPSLLPSDRTLRGPDTHVLPATGKFTGKLRTGTHEAEEIYVVKGLNKPLLGQPAVAELKLVQRVAAVNHEELSPMEQFPALFEGLGKLQGNYTIQLQEGDKPFALSTPRRVAIPLLKPVKQELQRMEQLGVIAKVEQPTEWCAGMVVVPKKNSKVQICVDLTHLNQSVQRERHPLPAVDQTLAQLAGAKVFCEVGCQLRILADPIVPQICPTNNLCHSLWPLLLSSTAIWHHVSP